MKIGYFEPYCGYKGSIEYDAENQVYYGLIQGIYELGYSTYDGASIIELGDNFHKTVDNYISHKNETRSTIVISAFPACGKTYATNNYNDNNFKLLDLDSSSFKWKFTDNEGKYVNPEFPNNYVNCIKSNIGKYDIIFVSSHLKVRQSLQNAGIDYCTVYPYSNLLNEWVGRMYRRYNSEEYINYIISHWDEFMKNIEDEPHGSCIFRLSNNEYLSRECLDELIFYMNVKNTRVFSHGMN